MAKQRGTLHKTPARYADTGVPLRRLLADAAYAEHITDEFIVPAVIGGYRGMQDGDGLLCVNFRA